MSETSVLSRQIIEQIDRYVTERIDESEDAIDLIEKTITISVRVLAHTICQVDSYELRAMFYKIAIKQLAEEIIKDPVSASSPTVLEDYKRPDWLDK